MVGSDPVDGSCTSTLSDSAFDKLTDANDKIQNLLASGVNPDDVSPILSAVSGEISDVTSLVESVDCVSTDVGRELLSHLSVVLGSYVEFTTQSEIKSVFGQCPTCFDEYTTVDKQLSSLIVLLDDRFKSKPCSIDCNEVALVNGYISTLNDVGKATGDSLGKEVISISSFSVCKSIPSSCSQSTWTSVIPVPCTASSLLTGTITATGQAEAAVEQLVGTNKLQRRAAPTSAVSSTLGNVTSRATVPTQQGTGSALKPMGTLAAVGFVIAMLI